MVKISRAALALVAVAAAVVDSAAATTDTKNLRTNRKLAKRKTALADNSAAGETGNLRKLAKDETPAPTDAPTDEPSASPSSSPSGAPTDAPKKKAKAEATSDTNALTASTPSTPSGAQTDALADAFTDASPSSCFDSTDVNGGGGGQAFYYLPSGGGVVPSTDCAADFALERRPSYDDFLEACGRPLVIDGQAAGAVRDVCRATCGVCGENADSDATPSAALTDAPSSDPTFPAFSVTLVAPLAASTATSEVVTNGPILGSFEQNACFTDITTFMNTTTFTTDGALAIMGVCQTLSEGETVSCQDINDAIPELNCGCVETCAGGTCSPFSGGNHCLLNTETCCCQVEGSDACVEPLAHVSYSN